MATSAARRTAPRCGDGRGGAASARASRARAAMPATGTRRRGGRVAGPGRGRDGTPRASVHRPSPCDSAAAASVPTAVQRAKCRAVSYVDRMHTRVPASAHGYRGGRCAAGGQQRQCGNDRPGGARAAERRRRQAPEEQGDAEQLDQVGRGLVAELQQAERRDQRKQRAIGHGARVVNRARLAAERERHGLGRFGAGEVEGGVPDEHQGERQQQRERNARGERRIERRRQQLDEGGTEPVRQPRRVDRQGAQRGRQPRRTTLRDGRPCSRRR